MKTQREGAESAKDYEDNAQKETEIKNLKYCGFLHLCVGFRDFVICGRKILLLNIPR